MNLHTLSRLPDDLGGPLGPPLPRAKEVPAPAPTVEQRPDGKVTTNPDGKMSFEPKGHETQPTQPTQSLGWWLRLAGEGTEWERITERPPLKVGDKVRLLADQTLRLVVLPDVFIRLHGLEGKTWERA